ncbi:EamA family transporter [Sphingobium sp. SCG-1]|uniref:DMT family transporter n=1 Tax=Sphingobium sp. SCG-1 TaxID=2072936 RepID=UPI000CD6B8C7|nr:DMT family transporter [Sphingobium sp. SCG-1]AUW59076.1 EamA family transporter [Sphingobium sp. SCG-1]
MSEGRISSLNSRPILLLGKAELALIGITVLWGATFLIVQTALADSGPLFFVGLRFATAAVITIVISRGALTKIARKELIAGSSIGAGIFLGYTLQTWGLQYIPSSTSAFITAAYVPLVPILQWLILRRRPHLMSWIGVLLAFLGLVLLAGPQPGVAPGRGEMLTLISTLAIAGEIVLISRWANEVDALRVTIVQLAVTALLAFTFMVPMREHVPTFSWLLVSCACGLGVMSAVIQLVMNWAQRTVSATRATLIYAGEPIWAGVVGRIAGELSRTIVIAHLCS